MKHGIRCNLRLVQATLLFTTLAFARRTVWAEMGAGANATLFQQGRTRFSVTGGYGSSNNNNYLVLGLGAGYYILDGLEAGLDGEGWLGSKPHIYKISPQLRYTLDTPQFKPYVGAFYRRTFFDQGLTNLDSAGGRAGLVFPFSAHTYLSAGGVYEHFFHCDSNIYTTCNDVYPEVSFSISY